MRHLETRQRLAGEKLKSNDQKLEPWSGRATISHQCKRIVNKSEIESAELQTLTDPWRWLMESINRTKKSKLYPESDRHVPNLARFDARRIGFQQSAETQRDARLHTRRREQTSVHHALPFPRSFVHSFISFF